MRFHRSILLLGAEQRKMLLPEAIAVKKDAIIQYILKANGVVKEDATPSLVTYISQYMAQYSLNESVDSDRCIVAAIAVNDIVVAEWLHYFLQDFESHVKEGEVQTADQQVKDFVAYAICQPVFRFVTYDLATADVEQDPVYQFTNTLIAAFNRFVAVAWNRSIGSDMTMVKNQKETFLLNKVKLSNEQQEFAIDAAIFREKYDKSIEKKYENFERAAQASREAKKADYLKCQADMEAKDLKIDETVAPMIDEALKTAVVELTKPKIIPLSSTAMIKTISVEQKKPIASVAPAVSLPVIVAVLTVKQAVPIKDVKKVRKNQVVPMPMIAVPSIPESVGNDVKHPRVFKR
jgi:hypothetical protein